jgi:hypothetical protein
MLNQPFFIPAVLFLILAVPLILGLLPRQWAIGLRTPKTLSDDTIWLRANRFAGWVMLCAGLIYLIFAWGMPCTAPCGVNFTQWLLHVGAFGLPLLIGIVLALRYVQTL